MISYIFMKMICRDSWTVSPSGLLFMYCKSLTSHQNRKLRTRTQTCRKISSQPTLTFKLINATLCVEMNVRSIYGRFLSYARLINEGQYLNVHVTIDKHTEKLCWRWILNKFAEEVYWGSMLNKYAEEVWWISMLEKYAEEVQYAKEVLKHLLCEGHILYLISNW